MFFKLKKKVPTDSANFTNFYSPSKKNLCYLRKPWDEIINQKSYKSFEHLRLIKIKLLLQ